MKIHIIIDETTFFLPDYFRNLMISLNKDDSIVGVSILNNPKEIPTLYSHVKNNIKFIGILSLFKMCLIYLYQIISNFLVLIKIPAKEFSVKAIVKKYNLNFKISKYVNSPESIQWIKSTEPDIILSSCSQIFKNELLNIPKLCCINRHCGLLPSYGGLFPIFQAIIHNEIKIGNTIHLMTKGIDKGKAIVQSQILIQPNDSLYSLYKASYFMCVTLTLDAIEKLRLFVSSSDIEKFEFLDQSNIKESYYSFPSKNDWILFRKKGIPFC